MPLRLFQGRPITATLTAGTAGATSVPLEISVSSGTLLDWDLDKSEDGGTTWSTVESGITGTTKTANNLNPATIVQFRGTARVEVEAVGMVTVTTAETSVPPATASLWYGPNWEISSEQLTEVRSYRHRVVNDTGTEWRTIAPLFCAMHESPGEIIGWRVRNYANAGAWTNGTFSGNPSFTFPTQAGRTEYTSTPKLGDAATLLNPIPSGGTLEIEVVRGAGNHASGKVRKQSLPSTCVFSSRSSANQNSINGDAMSWNDGYSAPWTHLFIGTDPAGRKTRKVLAAGDSTVAQNVPWADANPSNVNRQGYAVVASKMAADAADGFQVISFGRGTYTLSQMQSSQEQLAAVLGSEHFDWVFPQGWSFNASPQDQASLNASIASTQAVIDAWAAKGVRTGVLFTTPAGNQRNTGASLTYHDAAVAHWNASAIVLDISSSVADGTDPTILNATYSQDGVHVNIAGATPHGAEAYAETKAILIAAGEL